MHGLAEPNGPQGIGQPTKGSYPGGSRSSHSYLLSQQHLMERKVVHTIGK